MIYLDTSVLGALFFREPGAQQLAQRLARVRRPLRVSGCRLTEMASVAAMKQRTGVIDDAVRRAALTAFAQFTRDSLHLSEVEPADFSVAAALLEPVGLGLRAGDALHLAVARRVGADLATLHKRQAGAARHHRIGLFAVV